MSNTTKSTKAENRFYNLYHNFQFEGKPKTSAEAIKFAKLDWEIKQFPAFYKDDAGKQHPIKARFNKANVNMKTKECLGMVGDRYHVIQNKDAFNFFDEVTKSKEAIYTGAGSFNGGRMIWLQAKLPNDMVIFRDDVVEKKLTLLTSHDGTYPMFALFTPNRIVCTNQLVRLHRQRELTIRHTLNFKSKVSEARRVLGLALDFYKDFAEQATEMGKLKLTERKALDYFNTVLDIKKEEEAPAQRLETRVRFMHLWDKGKGNQNPASRHSLWTAYNAVTEFADHETDVRSADEDISNTLKSAWMGGNARLKSKAMDDALELVTVRN